MRYFLDTEFIEDGKTIDLISIGIVCEDGREFHALNLDCDWSRAGEWVKDNVLSKLPQKPDMPTPSITKRINYSWWRHEFIGEAIVEFVGDDEPEFWAYYSAYDWVAFCQLFGRMVDLPKGFSMYCNDLMQECDRLGFDPSTIPQENEHKALDDAKWNMKLWDALQEVQIVEDLMLEKSAMFEELAKH